MIIDILVGLFFIPDAIDRGNTSLTIDPTRAITGLEPGIWDIISLLQNLIINSMTAAIVSTYGCRLLINVPDAFAGAGLAWQLTR